LNCKGKPELRERLAAEYALGTLRGRARERLKRWMRDDPELARDVAKWESRLAPLAQAVSPVAPPARVWKALQNRLDGARNMSFSVWKALGWMASGAAVALVAVTFLLPSLRDTTPAAYVEAQRVEGARQLLETAEASVAEVAAACGFARVETMHRAFRRGVRVTPGQYRRHFRAVS